MIEIPQDGPLAGVSGHQIEIPVAAPTWEILASTMVYPDRARVTYGIKVGDHYTLGQWVVAGARKAGDSHWITLARLADPE